MDEHHGRVDPQGEVRGPPGAACERLRGIAATIDDRDAPRGDEDLRRLRIPGVELPFCRAPAPVIEAGDNRAALAVGVDYSTEAPSLPLGIQADG